MTDLNIAKNIFLKIYSDETLVNNIIKSISADVKQFDKYINYCSKGNYKKLYKLDAFKKLCVIYAYLPLTKLKYECLGIDDSVFYDTMSDISIWINDYKYYHNNENGLEEINWIVNHLNCKIFKLGRLQFHLAKYFYTANCHYNGKSINFGDKCLNLHIPRGEKLSIDACYDSFERAKVFFAKYFPTYPTDIYECFSWIFYSDNALYMDKNSNMIKFTNLFETKSNRELPADAIKYIFKIVESNRKLLKNKRKYGYYYDLTDFIPQSSLQSSCKNHIMSGGKLGDCKGQIIFNKN